jgi:Protein of unknown function (DUF2806)
MELPGEKLVAKLLEALSGTVSSVARPWLIKREARAKAVAKAESKSIERLAQEKLRLEMKMVRSGKALITSDYQIGTSATNDERSLAQIRADYLNALEASGMPCHRLIEVERQINLDQIASIAMDEAVDDEADEADGEPMDPDWFAQWRNRAQDVSNEQMQNLWAKVLKGQTKSSGTFSIHTMDFLSRMSKNDAELIAKVGNVAIDGFGISKNAGDTLDSIGLTFERLLYLEDLGILGGVSSGLGGLNISKPISSQFQETRAVMYNCNSQVLILHDPKPPGLEEVDMPIYSISVTGRELLKLATCITPPGYLAAAGKSLLNNFNHATTGELGAKQPDGSFRVEKLKPI